MPESTRYRVCGLDELPVGEFRIIQAGRREIGVVRTDAGLFAIRNTCPHKGAPLCLGTVGGTMVPSTPDHFEWGLDGRIVRCPWHGWEFDLETGSSAFGTTGSRAVTYPVEVDRGDVYVVPERKER